MINQKDFSLTKNDYSYFRVAIGSDLWNNVLYVEILKSIKGKKIEIKGAALTDQSDAWAILSLTGNKTFDVMDRLCPVDTRVLQTGDIVRSMIGHMSAIIEKTESGCKLMVFRAFAKTLLHEVCNSMKSVTAQEKLKDIC